MRRLVLIGLAAGLPGIAIAADAGRCENLTAQQDRNACISEVLAEADAVLNRAYRQLSDRLDGNGRRNLVAAERAWIVFRDRECDLRTGYDAVNLENNGTLAPYLVGECKLDLTAGRTADLLAQVKCPGGDLSCPP